MWRDGRGIYVVMCALIVCIILSYRSEAFGAAVVNSMERTPSSLRLARIFGSGMVLQAGGEGPSVWGQGTPGTVIDVQLSGAELSGVTRTTAKVDDFGVWIAHLPPVTSGVRNVRIVVSDQQRAPIVLEDVSFGVVLLCGGQSNMEFSVVASLGGPEEITEAATRVFDHIRLFSIDQRANSSVPLLDFWSTELEWARPSQPGAISGGLAHSPYGPFSAGETCQH